jgi:hypothetical protein
MNNIVALQRSGSMGQTHLFLHKPAVFISARDSRRKLAFTRLIAGALVLTAASLALAKAPTLCEANEVIVLSCATPKKVLSVCASNGLNANTGYLQYRIATLKKGQPQIDLVYPAEKQHPAKWFTYDTDSLSAKANTTSLRFSMKHYGYEVIHSVGAFEASLVGVFVETDKQKTLAFECPARQAIGQLGGLEAYGIPKTPNQP